MRAIQAVTERFRTRGIDVGHIRFPNDDKPLVGCDIGKLIYVFADGQLAVCPYIVFAARTPQSRYEDREFLVGNILDHDIDTALDDFNFHDRYQVGSNAQCGGCGMNSSCGKGCPAAIISGGGRIGDVDSEVCPVSTKRQLLQIATR
jgi:radical SAM protein with 4Fe4S-binding SPASM domain